MEAVHTLYGSRFTWDHEKAEANLRKHEIDFKEACEVFFDPFYLMDDASRKGEVRYGLTGYSGNGRLLYVVSVEKGAEAWRIVSARKATKRQRKRYEKRNDFI